MFTGSEFSSTQNANCNSRVKIIVDYRYSLTRLVKRLKFIPICTPASTRWHARETDSECFARFAYTVQYMLLLIAHTTLYTVYTVNTTGIYMYVHYTMRFRYICIALEIASAAFRPMKTLRTSSTNSEKNRNHLNARRLWSVFAVDASLNVLAMIEYRGQGNSRYPVKFFFFSSAHKWSNEVIIFLDLSSSRHRPDSSIAFSIQLNSCILQL